MKENKKIARRDFLGMGLAGGAALGMSSGFMSRERMKAAGFGFMGDPNVYPGGVIYVEDFAEDGVITQNSIEEATEKANGRPVVFPANAVIELPSGRVFHFNVPVDWRCEGVDGCTLKIDPQAEREAGPWMTFLRSVRFEGMHFDGSDRQNKGLRFAPGAEDSVILLEGSSHHWRQMADSSGRAPVGGFGAAIESFGRYRHLYAERFDLHHVSSDVAYGRPRPNVRGINFSGSARSHQEENGGPRLAEFHSCRIYWIYCGDHWGEGQIDADGIVWRNNADGQSRCLIQNCSFWANAKRPIKVNTDSDEVYVINCFFTEEKLPNGGYTRYRNFAYQAGSGLISGCVWDFPHADAWPTWGILNIVDDRGHRPLLAEGCRVRVRGDTPVNSQIFRFSVGRNPVTDDAVSQFRNWSIEVPGGIDRLVFARVDGYDTEEEAKKHGPRMILSNIFVSRINEQTWRLINASEGTRGAFARAWINGIVITAGNTNPRAADLSDVDFELYS